MSNTPSVPSRRRARRVAAVATLALAAGAVVSTSVASAAPSTVVTVKGVSPHLVPALTANQVITVTGTGFDESVITGVTVNGCTAPTYIVSSATTLLVKTDATCATTSTGVVTITDTSSNTAVSVPGATGGAQALAFVAAPTIATASASVHPVVTEATAGLSYAAQTAVGTSASTKGGTVIRVTSGSRAFTTSSAYPLSATLGGVALSSVTIGGGTSAGNWFTGVVGAHAADAAPVLKITQAGVSKSFAFGAGGASAVDQTFDFTYGGSTITVSPAFGPSKGGNKITIAGAGFSTTAANDVVTVGGVACPISGTPTATSLSCTVAASASPYVGPVTVQVAVTGGLTSVVSSGSTYTYVAQ